MFAQALMLVNQHVWRVGIWCSAPTEYTNRVHQQSDQSSWIAATHVIDLITCISPHIALLVMQVYCPGRLQQMLLLRQLHNRHGQSSALGRLNQHTLIMPPMVGLPAPARFIQQTFDCASVS